MTPVTHSEMESLLLRILERLGAIEKRLGAMEGEQALQREDFRLVRTELREQHSHLAALLGQTPAAGIRVAESG